MKFPHVVPEQLGYAGGCDVRHGWYNMSSLGQAVYYNHVGIIASAWW